MDLSQIIRELLDPDGSMSVFPDRIEASWDFEDWTWDVTAEVTSGDFLAAFTSLLARKQETLAQARKEWDEMDEDGELIPPSSCRGDER